MRLWLDDVRPAPWGFDLVAKTADEAIELLKRYGEKIDFCSLDHDLAEEHYASVAEVFEEGTATEVDPVDRSRYREKTGYDVLLWMLEKDCWPREIAIHTLNPRGRRDMLHLLENRVPGRVSFRSAPFDPLALRNGG